MSCVLGIILTVSIKLELLFGLESLFLGVGG